MDPTSHPTSDETTDHRRAWAGRLLGPAGLAVTATVGCVAIMLVTLLGGGASGSAQEPTDQLGQTLFTNHCAGCHGVDGLGIEDRGPSLESEGEASADFVLRTGRMPMAAPHMQATRGPVRFDEEEILALVAHVGEIGDGPDIPVVDIEAGDVSNGGEIYRLNCAACHVASGSGAPIGGGRQAPTLKHSTPTEVGQAIIVGPGSMPVFGSFDEQDINDVAAYVENLNEENTTGTASFGGAGPVAEGLAAWLLGLVPLIALTRWIGHPKSGRDAPEGDDGDSGSGLAVDDGGSPDGTVIA